MMIKSARADGEKHREQATLPPRPPFGHVICPVQGIDDGHHRRGTTPDRANDAQCQQAGLAAFGDLRKLPTEKPHEFLGRDSAERGQKFAQRILDRQIAE